MDRRQLRKEQRRRLVRLQKLLQLRYQIGAGGPSEAAHGYEVAVGRVDVTAWQRMV